MVVLPKHQNLKCASNEFDLICVMLNSDFDFLSRLWKKKQTQIFQYDLALVIFVKICPSFDAPPCWLPHHCAII